MCNPFFKILYGRVDRDFYRQNRSHMEMLNGKMLRMVCLVSTILLGTLVLITYLIDQMQELHPIYWLALAVSGILLLVSAVILPRHQRAAAPLYYIFSVLTYSLAIYLETFQSPREAASIIFTLFIILPALILDRPVIPASLAAAGSTVFCLLSAKVKASYPLVVQTDLVNAIYSCVMGICFTYFITNARLQSLQAMRVTQLEAGTDKLTGLTNKNTTEQLCGIYLGQTHTSGCALMIIDVDYFKSINDRFGHQQGDIVLRRVGAVLQAVFRESDIVGRIGGDEFAVLMRDVRSPAVVERKAAEVLSGISEIMAEDLASPLSCSIGVTFSPDGNTTYQHLFYEADTALYRSKKQGRGRSTFFSESGPAEEKPSVLVADHSEVSRAILRDALEGGYSVFQAENGLEALDLLRRWGQSLSAVLLDPKLPLVSGREIMQSIQSDPGLQDIPVIFLIRGNDEAPDGCAGMIHKPLEPKEVRLMVDRICS